MRKNYQFGISFVFISIVFFTIFSGCATAGNQALFGSSPVALVSVVANNDINWSGEAPTSRLVITRTQRRAMDADPDQNIATDTVILIDDAGEIIRTTLETSSNIVFAPASDVLNAASYKDARPNSNQAKDEMAKPEGFRYVYYRDNNFLSGFASETGINRMLFVTLNLTKSMSSGFSKNGTARANVSMTIMLKDETGKTLFNKVYESASRDVFKVEGGMYSEYELKQCMISAIQDACYYFLDDF
ncbi:MAG: hypothetical protein FWD78_05350 [Treponema sp.]|nr:hypothetical protein [Treponema sp.]